MSQSQTPSIDDYKKYVRELKSRIKNLNEINATFKTELDRKKQTGSVAHQLVKSTKSILLIQRIARGFIVRCRLRRRMRLNGSKVISSPSKLSSAASESERLVQEVTRKCNGIGLTLEMVFRAADSSYSNEVSNESLLAVLLGLKLGMSRIQLDRFVNVFDEDNLGIITRENYCAILYAFNVCKESQSSLIARTCLAKLLQRFKTVWQSSRIDFGHDRLTKNDFFSVLSDLGATANDLFTEKDQFLIYNHFDRKRNGFVEKSTFDVQMLRISGNASAFFEKVDALNESFAARASSPQKKVVVANTSVVNGVVNGAGNGAGNGAANNVVNGAGNNVGNSVVNGAVNGLGNSVGNGAANGVVNSAGNGAGNGAVCSSSVATGSVFACIVNSFEKNNRKVGSLFAKLYDFILRNRNLVSRGKSTLADFIFFISKEFGFFLDSSLINDLERHYSGARPTPNNSDNVLVDLADFTRAIIAQYGKPIDSTPLLKLLFALHLRDTQSDASRFFLHHGFSLKRKIDFSEFLVLAQKAFGANYYEATLLFAQSDVARQNCIDLCLLNDEINALAFPPQSNGVLSVEDPFERVRRKLLLNTLDTVERVVARIQEDTATFAKSLTKDTANSLFKQSLSASLTEAEISLLVNRIAFNDSSQIELYELLDFLIDNFGVKSEVTGVFMKVVAGYLDRAYTGKSTADFFTDHKMQPNGFYDRGTFVKKIKVIFGFTEAHAALFFDRFADADSDTLHLNVFISAIDAIRRNTEGVTGIRQSSVDEEKKAAADLLKRTKTETIKAAAAEIKSKIHANDSAKKSKNCSPLLSPDVLESKKAAFTRDSLNETELLGALSALHDSRSLELKIISKHILSMNAHVLNMKEHIRSYFDANQQLVLTKAFIYCDSLGNGHIDAARWRQLTSTLDLTHNQLKAESAPLQADFTNELQMFVKVAIELASNECLPLEYLHHFHSYCDSPISIILLCKHAALFYGRDNKHGFNFFRRLLKFLDFDKNGFFNYHQIRFIIHLMNARLDPPHSLVYSDLLENGITGRLIRYLGSNRLDKVETISSISYSTDSTAKLNILLLVQNLFFYIFDIRTVQSAIITLINFFNETKSFDIDYSDFLDRIGLRPRIDRFPLDLANDPGIQSAINDLASLSFRQVNGKSVFRALRSNELRKDLVQLFAVNPDDLADFQLFTIFGDFATQQVDSSSVAPAASNATMQHSLDNVFQKIIKSNLTLTSLTSLIENVIDDVDCPLNIINFLAFVQMLPFYFESNEVHVLFTHLDVKHDGAVTARQFISLFQSLNKKPTTSNARNASAPLQSPALKQVIAYLDTLEFHTDDFYNGKQTILNGVLAAFKKVFELVGHLTNEGQSMFIDPEFGPCAADPFGQKALYFDDVIAGYPDPQSIVWHRIADIAAPDSPLFFDKQAEANDVNQGQIGDCWFISALSELALNDHLIFKGVDKSVLRENRLTTQQTNDLAAGVFPFIFHFLSKFGIYVFKFFKDYTWRYVIIDDLLPCSDGCSDKPELVFAHCKESRNFWVPLLEKAYAKIHGCYQAIIGGQMDEGVVDMTGLVSEKVKINIDAISGDPQKTDALWKSLSNHIAQHSLIGCSIAGAKNTKEGKLIIKGEDVNLICGHAYGLLDLLEVNSVRLVRIRNPWGSDNPVTWNGRYSTHTKELTDILPNINKLIVDKWKEEAEVFDPDKQDGSFFMEFGDFVKIWTDVCIAVKFPSSYTGYRFVSEWNSTNSGGTPYKNDPDLIRAYTSNPQFILTVKSTQSVNVYISLAQEDGRIKSAGMERSPFASFAHKIALMVYKLADNDTHLASYNSSSILNKPEIKQSRDMQVALTLARGKYAVVPSTMERKCYAKFFLSLYFDCAPIDFEVKELRGSACFDEIANDDPGFLKCDELFRNALAKVLIESG